jgi:hypothetical protein
LTKPDGPRHLARLAAYDADGNLVLQEELPLGIYYEELHDLIDSEEFRRDHGVERLVGELYDDDGNLFQQIENTYAETGELRHGRIVHGDGTVTEVDR